jgi:lactoylglutathione lyase
MKFCWVTINVRNMKESLNFYTDIIGLEVLRSLTPVPGTEITFLGEGNSRAAGTNYIGTQIELIHNDSNPEPRHTKDLSLGFEVESLDDHLAVLAEKGITHITGPFQPNPMIRFFYVEDPDGVKIQFVEHAG